MSNPYEPQPPYGGQPPPQFGRPPPYGQPYYPPPPYGPAAGTNGFAIAALVCAFVFAPLGIIFGFVARSQIRRTGQQGDGMALAAIITGFVLTIFTVIIWIAVLSQFNDFQNQPFGPG